MADEFSRSVARVVAAQIAEASGFDACQESAIEILSDLLLRYLTTVCSSSHSYAELAGRSQSNLADVLLSLEELGVTADDLHQHLELQRSDVPFAHTLAPYPVRTQRPVPPTFADQGETHAAHVPAFLPAFPDPHTYQHTAAYAGHEADPHKQRQSMLAAKQKAEAALNKLHQRMSSKAAQPDSNPFLAAPAVEQLPVQPPAAAAAAAGASSAAAGEAAAPSAAAAAPPDGGSTPTPAPAAAEQLQLQQQRSKQQQQQQQQDAADGYEDEDALFEQAAVLKAFSSILPSELIAQELRGGLQEQQQQQQHDNQGDEQHKQQQQKLEDAGVIEETAMDIDGAGAAAGDAADGSVIAGSWLGWKQQQQQQQGSAAAAAGPNAIAEAEVLRFGIDSLASGRRAALSLAGRAGPQDVYEQQAKQQGRVAGNGGARQRKSKYDADPKLVQAEGILNLGPEAVFNAVGGMHDMWDTGNGME